MIEKKDILSMDINEMSSFLEALSEKKFRAKQIFTWLHKKKLQSFEEMTDLSKDLRQKLSCEAFISPIRTLEILTSKKDKTQKYLFEQENDTIIESVLMHYEYGSTVCVSSQAGCKMGCSFCATGLNGFQRNLSAGEMLNQIYEIERNINKRISRTVIMGQGEPFDNFENVVKFIDIINAKDGHEMGMRNITVSTAGIVPKIKEFADLGLQANLAVSLHAPNDEIRRRLMPIAAKYDYGSLMDVCSYYTAKTKRRITFEYALIDGINDGKEHSKHLAQAIQKMLCHVNLIPVNEVGEIGLKKSKKANEFADALQKSGVNATIRRTLGDDISGACGQLRNKTVNVYKAMTNDTLGD